MDIVIVSLISVVVLGLVGSGVLAVAGENIAIWLRNGGQLQWSRVRGWAIERVTFDVVQAGNEYHVYARFPVIPGERVAVYGAEDEAIREAKRFRIAVDQWITSNHKPRVVWRESGETVDWPRM